MSKVWNDSWIKITPDMEGAAAIGWGEISSPELKDRSTLPSTMSGDRVLDSMYFTIFLRVFLLDVCACGRFVTSFFQYCLK